MLPRLPPELLLLDAEEPALQHLRVFCLETERVPLPEWQQAEQVSIYAETLRTQPMNSAHCPLPPATLPPEHYRWIVVVQVRVHSRVSFLEMEQARLPTFSHPLRASI